MNFANYLIRVLLREIAEQTDNPDTQFTADVILDNLRSDVAYAPPQNEKATPKIAIVSSPKQHKNNTRFSSFTELISYFDNPHKISDTSVLVTCPCHKDDKPSLQITMGNKRYMFNCFAGCNYKDIQRAVGIEDRDFTIGNTAAPVNLDYPKITTTHKQTSTTPQAYNPADFYHFQYFDLFGNASGIKHRHKADKRLMRWSNYSSNLIYTADLKQLKSADTIAYAEGEKDADTLNRIGLAAFTCGSSQQWQTPCNQWARNKHLIIFADNDEPGIECARKVYDDCKSIAASVRLIIPTPDLHKGDITDYIERGGDIADLLKK